MDVAVGGRIRGEDRENDLLMLIAWNRSNEKNVGLIVAVLREINALGFLFDLVGPAVLWGQGEAIRQLDHGSDL